MGQILQLLLTSTMAVLVSFAYWKMTNLGEKGGSHFSPVYILSIQASSTVHHRLPNSARAGVATRRRRNPFPLKPSRKTGAKERGVAEESDGTDFRCGKGREVLQMQVLQYAVGSRRRPRISGAYIFFFFFTQTWFRG